MERKIGEIFEFEGVKLQVVESSNCGLNNTSCYFLDEGDCESRICGAFQRKDRTSVKFLKIGDKTIKPTKEELIKHCEKQIALNKGLPTRFSEKTMNEYKIFLELLKGRNINEIFDEKGEYIES